MKKIMFNIAIIVLLIVSCNSTDCEQQDDNNLTKQDYPINLEIVESFTQKMDVRRDSIAYYLSIGDSANIMRQLTEWEDLYGEYLYNVFREMNLRFHQDSIYCKAHDFLMEYPNSFWGYAHGMQGADLMFADEILKYLLWRSEYEVKLADSLMR